MNKNKHSASPAIEHITSAVFDNGRRGMPKPGCDCVQCFGYCLVDNDEAARQRFGNKDAAGPREGSALVLE